MTIKRHITFLICFALILLFSCFGKDSEKDESVDDGYKFREDIANLDKKEVILYFPSPDDGLLHKEKRSIFNTDSLTDQAKQTVYSLLQGPVSPELVRIIPAGTKLREIFLDQTGTSYIDFSNEFSISIEGGSDNEIALVYSIVNTVMDNFQDIKRVKILVDGREIQTITGHIDLTVPFKSNPSLIFNPEQIDSIENEQND
ncbi:MAG: GerMN domain-containing protein [Ignavibacteria bacterium]|nr:GerMN domain-containing protein [Ignavibacteria bacterium]